jgi:histidinol-phosphate aminotransferase
MDLTGNAYGPSLRVYEALSNEQAVRQPLSQMTRALVERIAEIERVPTDWILVGSGIDDLLVLVLRAYGQSENLVLFPPTSRSTSELAEKMGLAATSVPRSSRFTLDLDRDGLPAFPPNALSVIQNPNDPTGTPVTVQEAVRLIRRSQLLVVDERHMGYGARTLMPLVREFDRIAILRTFETWAGLNALPIAYAVAAPSVVERLKVEQLVPVPGSALIAAHATLDDLRAVESTVVRVRDEKARLFRMLRKLNMLQPLPSWANFILTQIERGDPSTIRSELLIRGIIVDVPTQDGLESTLRITATNHEATAALRAALLDIAPLI